MQEIKDRIDSFERVETRKRKECIQDIFLYADINANRIMNGLNGKSSSSYIQPWHVYPDLFEDLDEELEKRQEEIELENYKARFNRSVAAWNERFEKESKHDSGRNASEA